MLFICVWGYTFFSTHLLWSWCLANDSPPCLRIRNFGNGGSEFVQLTVDCRIVGILRYLVCDVAVA